MPVPALNTNYLAPDPASAFTKAAQAKNYLLESKLNEAKLANLPAEMKLKEAQVQNYLTQQTRDAEKFELEKEAAELKNKAERAKQYVTAMTAPSPEIGKKLAKEFGGFDVEWVGPDVTIKDEREGFEIKGPSSFVSDMYSAIQKDPTLLSNEKITVNTPDGPVSTTKIGSLASWAKTKGITLNRLKADTDMATLYGPGGQTKRVPMSKGQEYVPPKGWSLAKPEKDDSKDPAGQTLKDFELAEYGKLVPEMRGTPEYKAARLKWIRETKETSPYIEELAKQREVQNRKAGTDLRKEFNTLPEIKEYSTIVKQVSNLDEALKEAEKTKNFVAVDQAIITTWNKITDPNSVVRESEYARTPENLSLENRIKGKIEAWQKGGAGLTKEDREALVTLARRFKKSSDRIYKERLHEYKGYLSNYGLDPDKYLTPSYDKGGSLRDRAIQELESRGKEVNEDTIKQAMGILGGQK